ncbi:MAG TPA: hypothetical protein VGE97_10280, partial [Nitrososphaera sp.]
MALPLLLLVGAVVLPTTALVYAQTTTTANNTIGNSTTNAPLQLVTPSAVAQQIINNTKAE